MGSNPDFSPTSPLHRCQGKGVTTQEAWGDGDHLPILRSKTIFSPSASSKSNLTPQFNKFPIAQKGIYKYCKGLKKKKNTISKIISINTFEILPRGPKCGFAKFANYIKIGITLIIYEIKKHLCFLNLVYHLSCELLVHVILHLYLPGCL